MKRAVVSSCMGVLLLGAALPASAEPRTGAAVPGFEARDLTGQAHSGKELRGQRSVVVAITTRDAAEEAKRWVHAIKARVDRRALRPVLLMALDLPFFVPEGVALSKARASVPQDHWHEAWLDAHGDAASALDLAESPLPYVLVIGPGGKVEAVVHGSVGGKGSEAILETLYAAR